MCTHICICVSNAPFAKADSAKANLSMHRYDKRCRRMTQVAGFCRFFGVRTFWNYERNEYILQKGRWFIRPRRIKRKLAMKTCLLLWCMLSKIRCFVMIANGETASVFRWTNMVPLVAFNYLKFCIFIYFCLIRGFSFLPIAVVLVLDNKYFM